jgi:hypothetical protein
MKGSGLALACIVLAAVFAVSAPVAADEPEAPPPPAAQTAEAAKTNYHNRLICHSQTVTGSRIPSTTCATQSEIDARRRADQAWKQNLDLQRTRLPPPGGGVVGG